MSSMPAHGGGPGPDASRDAAEPSVELVGTGPEFDVLQRRIARVARSDATVLVQGETGTGKEAVARRIHALSARRDGPFVVADFAALNENLFQSELFGHEQGSFTGATRQKSGLFDQAAGGTLFLDEIGEASALVQGGLLRVLESRSVRRVGATEEHTLDVRLISATNRDLARLVAAGRFRQDLYYRLSTVIFQLEPLRERKSEIPRLVEHHVARLNQRLGLHRKVSPEALLALAAWPWPGNVRELQHVLEGALVMAEGDVLRPEDLPLEASKLAPLGASPGTALLPHAAPHPPGTTVHKAPTPPALHPLPAGEPQEPWEPLTLAELERRHIARVLHSVGGKRSLAAQLLGISERSLYRRLHALGAALDADDAHAHH